MKWISLLKLFLFATLFSIFVRFFLVENFRIASNSMQPTYEAGDLILVKKFTYHLRIPFSHFIFLNIRGPAKGEIIAFSLPETKLETLVKRVVATEDDEVEIKNGELFINKTPCAYASISENETYESCLTASKYLTLGKFPGNYGPIKIPHNHVFVLGDNRGDSYDSRYYGPVPYSCIKGQVWKKW